MSDLGVAVNTDDLGVQPNEVYFDNDYFGYTVGTGIFWIIGTVTPIIMMEFWLKSESFYKNDSSGIPRNKAWDYVVFTLGAYKKTQVYGLTEWTKIAWMAMGYGSAGIWGLLSLIWMLSYVKKPSYQKAYFKSLNILTIVSWILAIFVAAAFLVGALVTDDEETMPKELVFNMIYASVFVVAVIVVDLIVYLGMYEQNILYYKVYERDWWNKDYEEDEAIEENSDPFAL